ncbi:MAG: hypothetical protein Q8P63_01050 [Candidatus Nealsonbacteria bacterium]|nr:hypothetical protein [Candidatus Nealsonbacteria bacterium]
MLKIELVTLLKNAPLVPTSLIHVFYAVNIFVTPDEESWFNKPTWRIEKHFKPEIEQVAQNILNSWKEYTPELCTGLSAFACRIRDSIPHKVTQIPVEHLSLLINYVRLYTLLETDSGKREIAFLLQRFNGFIQNRIAKWDHFGEMMSSS